MKTTSGGITNCKTNKKLFWFSRQDHTVTLSLLAINNKVWDELVLYIYHKLLIMQADDFVISNMEDYKEI